MPAMEAMACGAALLTYDNGGCRDYARDRREPRWWRGGASWTTWPRGWPGSWTTVRCDGRIATAGSELITRSFDWDGRSRAARASILRC